jgi:hypothetical protein
MDKFCIFCGDNPQSKNLEHIIPQWLLKMTGDPKRKVSFGVDWRKPGIQMRSYAYDQFKFPSCEDCNTKFGRLESKAKPIIEKITNDQSLSGNEISVFLDWMDKVRIGLWLAYYYLDKNGLEINPKYHIAKRTRLYDRMVAIYKSDDSEKGVDFIGANTASFQFSPTCFTLVINQYHIFNLSTIFLFSRRIGFPYASSITYHQDGNKYEAEIDHGKERVMFPLMRKSITRNGVDIYQPIFNVSELGNEIIDEYYSSDYIKQNSLNREKGLGCIFYQKNGAVHKYPDNESVKLWAPTKTENRTTLAAKLANQTYVFQTHLLEKDAINDFLKEDGMEGAKKDIMHARKINNYFKILANNGPAKRSRRTR